MNSRKSYLENYQIIEQAELSCAKLRLGYDRNRIIRPEPEPEFRFRFAGTGCGFSNSGSGMKEPDSTCQISGSGVKNRN